jgi:hypothetical protein
MAATFPVMMNAHLVANLMVMMRRRCESRSNGEQRDASSQNGEDSLFHVRFDF